MTKKRILTVALAVVLIAIFAVSGTMAWLTHETSEIKNTFTSTDVDGGLEETSEDGIFEMIPGWTISKDPKVTVSDTSEDCWVFVTLAKSDNFDSFISYAVASGWEEVEAGVYGQKVTDANGLKGTEMIVLGSGSETFDGVEYTWADNEVLVKPTVTKDMMNSLTDVTYPSLTVKAYFVQLMKNSTTEFTAAEAWALVK